MLSNDMKKTVKKLNSTINVQKPFEMGEINRDLDGPLSPFMENPPKPKKTYQINVNNLEQERQMQNLY